MSRLIGAGIVGAAGPTSQVWTTPYPHALGDKARDKDGNEYVFCSADVAVAGDGIVVSISAHNTVAPLLSTSLLAARVGIARQTMAAAEGGWVQIYGIAFVQMSTAASTELTSVNVANVSVSEGDANGLFPIPQLVVTSPTGTLSLVAGQADGDPTSLTSVTSAPLFGNVNRILGIYVMSVADVSALPDRFIFDRYGITSVSPVSNTSGVVTLTTRATSHVGGEMVVFLNFPYLEGIRTS